MTAALLAGAAVALLLWQPRARLGAREQVRAGSPVVVRVSCAVAGLAAAALVGGTVGLVVGAGLALVGPRVIGRLDDTESEDAEVAAVLPLALELLDACLAGGAAPLDAVVAVATGFPGPCGRRLGRVAAALAVGSPAEVAWRGLGEGRDAAGAAARALARAAEGGAPVAASVAEVAAEARRRERAAAHRRAARAGGVSVLPLGACFLPAFVLLGVVPAVVGLAGPLLSSLS